MSPSSSFNEAAELYDEVRPGYAAPIIGAIIAQSSLPAGGRILEIGAGTGQITAPFAARGYEITALEPGSALAKLCAAKCRHTGVQIVEQRFEDFLGEPSSFDLVLSAQAFHWIDPALGIAKAAALLKSSGAIALAWHFDRSEESEFYRATNPIYDRFFPRIPGTDGSSLKIQVEASLQALASSPAFAPMTETRHFWSHSYSQYSYRKLLQTHSPVLAMEPATRAGFLREIGEVIRRFGGTVERAYETYLAVARRMGGRVEKAVGD